MKRFLVAIVAMCLTVPAMAIATHEVKPMHLLSPDPAVVTSVAKDKAVNTPQKIADNRGVVDTSKFGKAAGNDTHKLDTSQLTADITKMKPTAVIGSPQSPGNIRQVDMAATDSSPQSPGNIRQVDMAATDTDQKKLSFDTVQNGWGKTSTPKVIGVEGQQIGATYVPHVKNVLQVASATQIGAG